MNETTKPSAAEFDALLADVEAAPDAEESQRARMIEALATVPGRDDWPLLCMTPEDVR